MALSMEQLDTQTVDLLPAREVMSSCGGGGKWGGGHESNFHYTDNSFNVGDVLSNNLNGNALVLSVLSPSATSS